MKIWVSVGTYRIPGRYRKETVTKRGDSHFMSTFTTLVPTRRIEPMVFLSVPALICTVWTFRLS